MTGIGLMERLPDRRASVLTLPALLSRFGPSAVLGFAPGS